MSTIITPSQPATSSALKRLIIEHPLSAFFVIAFVGTWIAFLPLDLAQNGLGLLPYTIPEIILPPVYWFSVLGAILGPSLASFAVTAVTAGRGGVRQLLGRYLIWRVGLRWYLFVLVGVPVLQLVTSSILLGIAPLEALVEKWPSYFTTFLPNVLIIALAVQIWEEGGWSGYAVPALEQRFGAWRACLVMGPMWALWHLPAFFVPGQIFDQKVDAVTMVVQMVLMIIVAIPTRVIMTWVFNNTKASVLIAILLHSALDASNSASDYIKQLLSTSQAESYGLASALIFPIIAAVLVLIFTKGRLSYKSDRAAQSSAALQPATTPAARA